jgi:hypothetical protein
VKLSSQHLAEVMDAMRGAATATAGTEKRRAARMDVHTAVMIIPIVGDTAGRKFTALTRDVSAVGIGLLQATSCALNEQLLVHLPRTRKPPLVLLCNVMHVRMLADGLYLIGAEFVAEGRPAVNPAERTQAGAPSAGEIELQRIRSSILS